jgi:UDP-N-acetylmuramoyl-tripeptide--D-alanyl-D-alanine ligase
MSEAAPAMMSLQQALQWLPGGRLVGDGNVMIGRVHTDTRTLAPGDLFVALKGERHDANDFLPQARNSGAVAAISHSGQALMMAGLPGIVVDDTRLALGQLAGGWRSQFKLPLIAVTGSNGKTTVTQMLAAILTAWKGDAALTTQGNLNNDIGVPLTLLRLRDGHEVAAVELGMNHPGEISALAALAQPTVALVNNAQREHLEFMATVAAVARENGSVISALGPLGTAVFPADDAYAPLWSELSGSRPVMTFTDAPAGPPADVRGQAQWTDGAWSVQSTTPVGPLAFRLGVAGRHNVRNALAALACALVSGAPLRAIGAGLEAFQPVKGRSRAFVVNVKGHQVTVVDDSYNANPDSVHAAIDVLAELPGPRLLVLGDMGEVGDQGLQFHAEAGSLARERGVDLLFTLGAQSAQAAASFAHGQHFEDIAALNAAVKAQLPNVASVLVKGSRFMKMERVVQAISDAEQEQQQTPAEALKCS